MQEGSVKEADWLYYQNMSREQLIESNVAMSKVLHDLIHEEAKRRLDKSLKGVAR